MSEKGRVEREEGKVKREEGRGNSEKGRGEREEGKVRCPNGNSSLFPLHFSLLITVRQRSIVAAVAQHLVVVALVVRDGDVGDVALSIGHGNVYRVDETLVGS